MQKLIARKPIRLKNYDYSENGYYFITVCSKKRENIFAEIKNVVGAGLVSARVNIGLTKIGSIIDTQWNNIFHQYNNVKLDQYIIMPNHIHGIIIINKNNVNERADTRPAPTTSDVICSFKSKCTMAYLNYLKQNNTYIPLTIWQRSFYDHIIRDDRTLNKMREYIENNPENWENDVDNLINL